MKTKKRKQLNADLFVIDKTKQSLVSQVMEFGYTNGLFDKMIGSFQTRYRMCETDEHYNKLEIDVRNYLRKVV